MRKIGSILICILLFAVLIGCSNNTSIIPSPPDKPAETKPTATKDTHSNQGSIATETEEHVIETEGKDTDYHITYANSFSEGYAWISVYRNIDSSTTRNYQAVINTDGEICYCTEEAFSPSQFEGGASVLSFEDGTKKVVDPQGNVLFSTNCDLFDDIVAYGGGYYLVYKYHESFSEAGYDIFIIDGAQKRRNSIEGLQTKIPEFVYCGDGVFANKVRQNGAGEVTWRFYDGASGNQYEVGGMSYWAEVNNIFNNGYAVIEGPRMGDLARLVSCDGAVTMLDYWGYGKFYDFGPVSDGGFVCVSYYDDLIKNVWFYDINTGNITELGNYGERVPLRKGKTLTFKDGSMLLPLTGADGKNYYTIMDKSGSSLFDPIQCSSVSFLNSRILVDYGNRSTVTDLQGNEVFENEQRWYISPYCDGFACINRENYIDENGSVLFEDGIIPFN